MNPSQIPYRGGGGDNNARYSYYKWTFLIARFEAIIPGTNMRGLEIFAAPSNMGDNPYFLLALDFSYTLA